MDSNKYKQMDTVPTRFVPQGTVCRQVNIFVLIVGLKECKLKIEYAASERILDLSKFQSYLSEHTDLKTTDLLFYCQNLHESLKTALLTKDLNVKLEARTDDSTLSVECKFKKKKRKREEPRVHNRDE